MKQELLAAIHAAPDDDGPRLVFADWCADRGDSARAELVRVELELAALPAWDARAIPLQVRHRRLLEAHLPRWLAELPRLPGVRWSGVHRGFVAHAVLDTFERLAEVAPRLAAHTPLHRITVPWPESAAQARAAPRIPTLRALRIEQAVRDRDQLAWLGDAPVLSTLVELQLVDGHAPDQGLAPLLASPHLRGLQALHLERGQVGHDAIPAIVQADFPDLRALTLQEADRGDGSSWSEWEGGLDEPAMQALADWPGLARLRALDLSWNRLLAPAVDALLTSPNLDRLERLVLDGYFPQANDVSWDALPPQVELRSLSLADNYLSPEDAEQMAEASCLRHLVSLNLARSAIQEPDTLPRLFDAPFADTLQVLDLQELDSVDVNVGDVLGGASLPRMHTLNLAGIFWHLEDESLGPLARSEFLARVRALDISDNDLTDDDLRLLVQNPHIRDLAWLRARGLRGPARARLEGSGMGQRLAARGALDLDPPE